MPATLPVRTPQKTPVLVFAPGIPEHRETDENAPRVLLGVAEAGMRRLLGSPLRADGYEVVEAADTGELLASVAFSMTSPGRWHEPVDAIVVDAREDTSIVDALEKLRKAGWRIPAVVLVAFGDTDTADRVIALRATAVFRPPFHAVDLRIALGNLVR